MHFTFLGTSGAVPGLARDTTSLAFVGGSEVLLVDVGGSPLQKLLAAAIDPRRVSHVLITHIHPDHAYGLPALIQNLILLGRTAPLPLFCRGEHVDALTDLLDLFELRARTDSFPVPVHGVEPREGIELLRTASFVVSASPNAHGNMPNLALRFEIPARRTAVVYSSDTEPCDEVARLARGADTLIHEATFPDRDRGRFGGHSTAAEAGQIAAKAEVRRLILCHVEADYHGELDALVAEARAHFQGPVEIAQEFRPYPL
ncbi:MAG: MBL fold metallo-hydrolase [Candidatus Rokubacteria bacterium]|nr:MBL fold metallo-hydrolase [Candidatus Rokubacteria bacterium]